MLLAQVLVGPVASDISIVMSGGSAVVCLVILDL